MSGSSDASLSELARREPNHIECDRCGDPITDWMNIRRYGFWDTDKQWFESHGGGRERYCRDCWDDREGRPNGAHFYPESGEHLFDVLDAANGALAATLTWWTGRPSIRVVDGEPEAAVTKPRDGGRKPDGTPILAFESEEIEFGKDEFDEGGAADPSDRRGLVLLRDPEQTSLAGVDS